MTIPVTDIQAAQILTDHGIRLSIQRIQIYQNLCASGEHPTAEMVYAQLASSIPTLSRTTVYNTLKLFAEKQLVQTLLIEDDEMRYDADTEEHLHFKCHCCGKVFDAATNNTARTELSRFHNYCNSLLPDGFLSEKIQTYFWGRCDNCAVGSYPKKA